MNKTELALGNILAVIHRDGGQYKGKYGVEKAAKDAESVVIALRMICEGAWRIKDIREHSHPTRDYCPLCGIRDGIIRLDKLKEERPNVGPERD